MLSLLLACTGHPDGDGKPTGDDTADTNAPVVFDDTFDVIVVGSGPAGTSAAVTAAEAGASVLLLERDDTPGTGMNLGGRGFAVGTRWQEELGFTDSVDLALSEWEGVTGVPGDTPTVTDFVENSAETVDWLVAHGMEVGGVSADADAGSVPRLHELVWRNTGSSAGNALISGFSGELRTGVEVTGPVMQDGAIVGLRWTDLATGLTGASAASAVVLATGGFLRDRAEVEAVAPELAGRPTVFETNLTSDGGGLPFLDAVGAAMQAPEHIGVYVHSITDSGLGDGEALFAVNAETGMLVGEDGARFADETLEHSLRLFDRLPDGDVYAILSAELADQVTLMRPAYNWSNPPEPDAFTIDDALGTAEDVFAADTLEDLAAQTGIDAAGLAASVEDWNDTVATHARDPWDRDVASMRTLDGDRWVALRLAPGLAKNFGGVATDGEGHVLDGEGTPIAGLYAAGEVAGMVFAGGAGRGFSGSVMACYWSGRVAGGSAAAFAGR
jgi:fumarate reductase flavoprotein subunit